MDLQSLARRLWDDLRIHPVLTLCLLMGALFVELVFRVPGFFLYYFLPIVGLSATALSLVHLLRKFPSLAEVEQLRFLLLQAERWATIPVIIFVGHSLIVLANGASDYSAPVEQRLQIASKSTFEIDFEHSLFVSWAEVKPATQPSESIGYVLLPGLENHKLWGGEIVLAQVHAGTLGLPWISGIARDEEYYFRQALQRTPRSAAVWKNLVSFYRSQKRWDEAVRTIYEYLNVYPYAYQFAGIIAGQLVNAGRLDQAIPLLEYVAGMSRHYDDYQLLGVALRWRGDKGKAVKIFEASIPLAPHDWEVYFHLAETYSQMGRNNEAIAMNRKVLERRPDFPEVEKLLKVATASSDRSSSK